MSARLDLGKVLAGAFLVPWWHRKAFARALAIPLGLIVLHSVVWYYYAIPVVPNQALWLVYALYGLLFTMFAVTCHSSCCSTRNRSGSAGGLGGRCARHGSSCGSWRSGEEAFSP
jgi:hypothetical protein